MFHTDSMKCTVVKGERIPACYMCNSTTRTHSE